jgi:hypothetical protein
MRRSWIFPRLLPGTRIKTISGLVSATLSTHRKIKPKLALSEMRVNKHRAIRLLRNNKNMNKKQKLFGVTLSRYPDAGQLTCEVHTLCVKTSSFAKAKKAAKEIFESGEYAALCEVFPINEENNSTSTWMKDIREYEH